MYLDAEIFSGGEKINEGKPILVKKSILIGSYDGGSGAEQFFVEFKSKSQLNTQLMTRYDTKAKLANRFLLKCYDRSTQVKSELQARQSKVAFIPTYGTYLEQDKNYYFYSINLDEIPLLLILGSSKIEIDLYRFSK